MIKERSQDDQNNALGSLHKPDFAGANQSLGASPGVANHERGSHDEGNQNDVEETIAASIVDEQAKE